ncbi:MULTISPECIES: OsmC family protein [unclassified Colwellia]|uniref:OsmC family protein n=1 Tax=unclassified Colwellia TaxID=196834 RepID=UPI0015F46C51|nr:MULTISPECIES: OsmC family protein [unclassified Colwellia]MBA6234255.1 OsmC family protein [Colwellia sp. MB02u-7]MBA6237423.1 OsmC family protein [Colwellia sp. MB02u-11]MBA6256382.1 OsmC family protein [Colwellia sp. MB3u-28]MBA6260266.1 OsmC family protein [Colwellia sp. MB3u-41]MBA6300055.1 OsmC family protein [Colwellia sp. MB3u-22]
MKASVKWMGKELFMGTSDSGHTILLDANAGTSAPSPLENVLISLGACSSVDIVSILEKSRQNISACRVDIQAKRVDSVPKMFSDIHLRFVITGQEVAEKHVERAVKLSADKYCSVALMLNKTVNITHDFEIIDD